MSWLSRLEDRLAPRPNQPFVLNPPGSAQANPFWVVGATKEVIDGHGGIWQTPFLLFIASLVFQHVQVSRKRRRKRHQ
jgi:hypothetical protein